MEEEIIKENKKLFPDEIVYESKYFVAAQDWEIAIPGFYIVSPKRKLRSLVEFSEKESIDFIKTVTKVRKAMLDVLGIKDVYYFQNEDTPYGFHFWMLPHYDWMDEVVKRGPGLLVPVWKHSKEKRATEKDIKETKEAAQKIRDYFSKKQ